MKNNKILLIIAAVVLVIVVIVLGIFVGKAITNSGEKKEAQVANKNEVQNEKNNENNTNAEEENKTTSKIDIVDVNSTDRPFAITVNNTPVAVKVQEGLNKAFLIYELPTEGATSRLLALFKDVNDITVGTIRSARHNFVDYALESDAIFVAYGWSHYAEDDLKNKKSIDYIQGLFGGPFWRNNPEKLASEHTAYTSIAKLRDSAKNKGIRTTSSSGEKTIVLKYNEEDVDLSSKSGAEVAKSIDIPYGAGFRTQFKYDEEKKQYNRIENGNANVDHSTKEQFTAKNIIVQKITYNVCDDNYYWNLHTQGSGDGYYITNGYAVPIKWSKASRSEKTKYTYLNGDEIEVSDGRTFIEVQTTSQKLTIE